MNGGATSVLTPRTRSTTRSHSPPSWCGLVLPRAREPLGIWRAIGGAAVALGVAVLLFDRPASTALLQPSPRLVLLGAAAGGLMVAATYLLYPVLARIVPFIATDTAQLYAAFRAPSLVVASVALVPVILGEELVWRGVVQASLVDHLGALERRRAGSRRVCAGARASRLPGADGRRVLLRTCVGRPARQDGEPGTNPGGSPGVGRVRPALAATGRQMKKVGGRSLGLGVAAQGVSPPTRATEPPRGRIGPRGEAGSSSARPTTESLAFASRSCGRTGLLCGVARAESPASAALLAGAAGAATAGLGSGAATGPLLAVALVPGRHGVSPRLLQQVVLPAVDDWQRRAGRGMTPGAQIQGGAPGARAQAVSTPRRTSAGSSMKCGTTWPA